MPAECISFRETGYFSKLICDYTEREQALRPFYERFPEIGEFKKQIEEKQAFFSEETRSVLAGALQEQYKNTPASEATLVNLRSLSENNTFTVTTGHQLNIFTGPSYFLYKIITTVNLAAELKSAYPAYHFVPVYWMATEDHDFEEISHFNFNGKNFQWNRASGGAVGALSTEGLDEVLHLFASELGAGRHAEYLKDLFQKAYLEHKDLTEATRFLVNELFGEYGLVIVDGNDKALKKCFVPYMQEDLARHTAYQSVSAASEALKTVNPEYGIQVNPREINLFYLQDGLRERIEKNDEGYFVHGTDIKWKEEELLEHLREDPQQFSPNVLLRPLYQEVILPNLCYIGGGGEIAYWLQLKGFFQQVKVPFPVLLLRNSVLLVNAAQSGKMKKLNISASNLFLKRDDFINRKVREISNIDIDFSPQKKHLQEQFKSMYELADQTDKTFLNAVKAQEVKQLRGLDNLEKRLLKAQKRKLSDHVIRITEIQNQLFPNGSLQERVVNFSQFYLEYGEELVPKLMKELKPLQDGFSVLTL
ncbi:bacillithiol biosynthesis cysteine-adding enzyme BshC [Sinomicrobium weinanense]|uniref:Putative cysteine ligase BshC n=1 Tax=Sinomicrobium weinanense TaxID=2842200 RepID=A0A926Q0W5_9FLAO|nr:bacillithiol biosynthesis cysteine-adding enzyme BshC [Sinomicrobium weinanense]MBC9795292.1 bacillithiol biosynthesis cysteine-adding enzyme BshC [Sinomicrobium weinanense]MBU3125764.1 bacillithiol biosynthesis cysteine-adding enzyme BshC [Sinomicrobium weinanense]